MGGASPPIRASLTVLLIRVLDVSDARIGGDAILITDSSAGGARHVLIDAGEHGPRIAAWLEQLHVDTLAAVNLSHAQDRKSTRLESSHSQISYSAFCLKKKKHQQECRDRSRLPSSA